MTENPQPPTRTPEEAFRELIDDVVLFVQHLAPYCKTPEEMVGVLKAADGNPGQQRLLHSIVTSRKK